MARDATAVAGLSVVIAGKAPLEKPLGSSARLLFPPETYQQIGSGRLSYSRGGFLEASGRPRAARMSPAAALSLEVKALTCLRNTRRVRHPHNWTSACPQIFLAFL